MVELRSRISCVMMLVMAVLVLVLVLMEGGWFLILWVAQLLPPALLGHVKHKLILTSTIPIC